MFLGKCISACKRMKLDPNLSSTYTSAQNRVWKFKCKRWNYKTPRRKCMGKLHDIDFCNDFMDITLKVQASRAKVDNGTNLLKRTSVQPRRQSREL